MKTVEKAIETMATINADHQLVLDEPLPLNLPPKPGQSIKVDNLSSLR